MVFNTPDPAPFQQQLRKANFYTDWRSKFGDPAWQRLESITGPLA